MNRLRGLFLGLTVLGVALLAGCADQSPWTGKPAAASQAPAATTVAPTARAAAAGPATKVALLLPLSGKNAALGQAMLQAAQLAMFDIGNTGFTLVPEDTKASPEGARQAADAAIRDGAQLILGPLFSSEVKAVKPVAASHNINVVAFSTDWTQGGGNAFVIGFLPFSQVQRVVAYAAGKGYRHIGLIAPQGDYGQAVDGYFQSLAVKYNVQVGPVVHLNGSAPVGASFASSGDDAVLFAVGGAQAAGAAAQLTQAGLAPGKVKRLGTGLWDDSAALAADPNLQGAWYAAPQADGRRNFEAKYQQTYGQPAPRLATLAYDATALASVLARSGRGFDREALTNPNGFAGIDGIFRFRGDGLVERGMAVMQISGGATTVADPAPRTFQAMAY